MEVGVLGVVDAHLRITAAHQRKAGGGAALQSLERGKERLGLPEARRGADGIDLGARGEPGFGIAAGNGLDEAVELITKSNR